MSGVISGKISTQESLQLVSIAQEGLLYGQLTNFGKGNKLAILLASFKNQVNSLLDCFLEVEPSWLSLHTSSLVLTNGSDHVDRCLRLNGLV
jgi:hypothetical protein